jgi:hypothetical protein
MVACLVAGMMVVNGGCTDPEVETNYLMLSNQKHRTELPVPSAIQDMSLDSVIYWSGSRQMPYPGLRRERWSDEDRGYVFMQEWHAVRVVAYMIEADNQPDGDVHISLGDSANADLSTSLIVEMIPSYRQTHQWQLYNVEKYLHQQVRVTGWLMYDEEHSKGPDRAGVWEIHPITKFEVLENGEWHDL